MSNTSWTTWLAELFNPNENLTLRRWQIYNLAFTIFRRLKLVQFRTKGMTDEKSQPYWDAIHASNARDIYKACCSMEGLLLKAGQYISTRSDVMPLVYVTTLGKLTDSVPPKPFKDVMQTLREELGDLRNTEFSFIDQNPLASASIAQVHRATLKDGTNVVLKVQHRNIGARVQQDLTNLREVIELVAKWEPDYDFRPLYTEWAKELPQELDFQQELKNMKDVQAGFDEWYQFLKTNNSKEELTFQVRLAETFPHLSTKRVLVMRYIDGIRLSQEQELAQAGIDVALVNRQISKSYAHQLFVQGNFNADPHSGNFIVAKDDANYPWIVYLLDFGLTKRLDPSERRGLSKMLVSAADFDFTGLLSSLEEIGLKILVDAPEDSMKIVRFLFRPTAPSDEARKESEANRKEWEDRQKNAKKDKSKAMPPVRKIVEAFPGCLILFGRVLNLLRGLSSKLSAKEDYLALMAPFARESLKSEFGKIPPPVYSPGPQTRLQTRLIETVQELGDDVLGIQIVVMQNDVELANLARGYMGTLDPRYMQNDSLTNAFSVTKTLLALTLHLLVQNGRAKYDDLVVKHWPEYCQGPGDWNGKEKTTIAHVLQHRAGLSDVGTAEIGVNPAIMQDWNKMVSLVEKTVPNPCPGQESRYHFFSYAWVAGGLIEKIAGKPLMKVVKELAIDPIPGAQDSIFVGIPAKGVEQRLTTVSMDFKALTGGLGLQLSSIDDVVNPQESKQTVKQAPSIPTEMGGFARQRQTQMSSATLIKEKMADASFQSALVMSNPLLFNDLKMRRAIIPSANGHFTAEALAKYYQRFGKAWTGKDLLKKETVEKLMWGFSNPGAVEHDLWEDAEGEKQLRKTVSKEQLEKYRKALNHIAMGGGLMRYHFYKETSEGLVMSVGLGHAGFGGSLGFSLPEQQVSVAIIVTKLDITAKATRRVMQVIGDELGLGTPLQFESGHGGESAIEPEEVLHTLEEAPVAEFV